MNHQSSTTIHLMPQEELSSLLARLKDSHAEVITLVVPEKSVIAQGMIGLQVLADEAGRMDKKLTISSDSKQIQRLAKRVGLEVSGSDEGMPEHGFMAGADVAALGVNAMAGLGARVQSAEPLADEMDGSDVLPESEVEDKNNFTPTEPIPAPVAAEPAFVSGSLEKSSASSGWLQRLKGRFTKSNWKWAAGAIGLLLVVVFAAVYAFAYFIPTATVTVFAEKQLLDRDLSVKVDPLATTSSVESLTVPGTAVEAVASKSQTFPASGKKDVGTKASGAVTIFNKTNEDKSFAAGTIVTANSLQFLTAKAVTVEAATTETGIDPITLKMTTTTTPGSANVTVNAADIGDNYNLNSKTAFTIGKFADSSYAGRNEADLAGGTKKSVTIVTDEDQAQALETLEAGVQEEATKALQAKISGDMELLKDATKQTVSTKDFSKDVGDQADEFSLTLEVTAVGMAINPNDIQTMLDKEIEGKVPDGYKLDTENSKVDNRVVSTDEDGVVNMTSSYTAQVIPQVDVEAMREQIAGKNPSVVADYLKSQPNLKGYDIVLSPKLPGPFYRLPPIKSRITIKVEVK